MSHSRLDRRSIGRADRIFCSAPFFPLRTRCALAPALRNDTRTKLLLICVHSSLGLAQPAIDTPDTECSAVLCNQSPGTRLMPTHRRCDSRWHARRCCLTNRARPSTRHFALPVRSKRDTQRSMATDRHGALLRCAPIRMTSMLRCGCAAGTHRNWRNIRSGGVVAGVFRPGRPDAPFQGRCNRLSVKSSWTGTRPIKTGASMGPAPNLSPAFEYKAS